jgi:hypothetical protein
VEEDMYLPIAAEAEAASRAIAELPAGARHARRDDPENLPARVERGAVEHHEPQERGTPLIPSIPDATKAAARWIRPLVPPFVARVIDNTTQPLRTARQVFEEVEEIAFSLKRTRKVTVNSESSDTTEQPAPVPPSRAARTETNRIESSRGEADPGSYRRLGANDDYQSLDTLTPGSFTGLSVGSSDLDGRHELVKRDGPQELVERDGPHELRSPEGPRQLPPGR